MRAVSDHRRNEGPQGASAPDPDAAALEQDLQAVVRGEVRFDAKTRGLYATDASNYRQIPIGVVLPRDKADVVAAVDVCRRHAVPILGRGGGTSLAGQGCNVAVIFDFSKYMNQVLEIDADAQAAVVQPGCVLDTLRDAAELHGLTFGPDPATHGHCTLGGMIANNSCGVHSQMAGRTVDNVLELEVLTYSGERFWVGPADDIELDRIIQDGGAKGQIHAALRQLRDVYADEIRRRYPDLPRLVSGYNLDALLPERCNVARALVGTESTCVIVLEARLRLVPSPPERAILVVGWPDVATLADHVPEIVALAEPIGLEAFDHKLVEYMRQKGLHEADLGLVPQGSAWMIVEFGGATREEADEKAQRLKRHLDDRRQEDPRHPDEGPFPTTMLYDHKGEVDRVWAIRESGLGATARVPNRPDTWPGWEDSAVPPARLGDYLRDLQDLLDAFDLDAALYGHFGMGCVHTRLPFDLQTAHGIRAYRAFVERAAELVTSYGGSLSGEHGDGQARAELLGTMFGPAILEAMRRFKGIWDPGNKMNPGKVVDPDPLDANLRLGADYDPWEPRTVFGFQKDEGRFSRAATRCVGVGKCRDLSGTMCPSYQVTLEEEHSTRGRARLLFEMLQGDVVVDRWNSEEVKEALDLCISCKGCLHECPVGVDMATYKAEFMHHYHKRNRRPRHAYAFGYVDVAARLAAKAPRLANLFTQRPLGAITKRMVGLAPARPLPRFAKQDFRSWFHEEHTPRVKGGKPVLLFPDTFTNHFEPHIPRAAVHALEAAGFRVEVPTRPLCCGRPLYDHGMLRRAKRLMRRNMAALREPVRSGTPMVVMEPSCAATFRDELPNLFPASEDARRLADLTFTLGGFLDQDPQALDRLGLPTTVAKPTHDGSARDDAPPAGPTHLVQRHCHHQAVMGFEPEQRMLDRLGIDHEVLDSGCCGLAGSFGFEAEHYDVSMQMGERVLLPRVRDASAATKVLADGFSCRNQVAHGAGRRGHHLAELLADHLDKEPVSPRRRSLFSRIPGGKT